MPSVARSPMAQVLARHLDHPSSAHGTEVAERGATPLLVSQVLDLTVRVLLRSLRCRRTGQVTTMFI